MTFPKGGLQTQKVGITGLQKQCPCWGLRHTRCLCPGRPSLLACELELAQLTGSLGSRGEAYSRVNDEFTGLGQVLGQQGPPHVTAQCVLEEKQERQTPDQ